MRIQKRIKRSTKQYILVAFICSFVIGGAAIFTSLVVTSQIKDEYEELLEDAYYDMKTNQRNVYVASKDIRPGDTIRIENVERKTVYSSQPQEAYISDDDLGKVALIAITMGTQVLDTMVAENVISSKLREAEYEVIHMNQNISDGDTVDVRIFFPNGESYVVLAKKEIKGWLTDLAKVLLWLEEEEILRMSAAIVDAGQYAGSGLYVTKYIEPQIQEASAITYTPSLSILSLIESNPNIVERCSQELNKQVRKAMENRLAISMGLDVSTINWDVEPYTSFALPDSAEDHPDTSDEPSHFPIQKDTETMDQKKEAMDEKTEAMDENKEATEAVIEESEDRYFELGEADYLYYAEEAASKDGDIEYGE